MQKLFLFLSLNLLVITGFSQGLINKVPAEALTVIKYRGTSLSQKLPSSKFDSYTFLKKKLFSEFDINNKTSLESIGIDLKQDAYQYLLSCDTSSNFVTIAAIKNIAAFEKFIKGQNKNDSVIVSKKNFKYLQLSEGVFIGWNGSFATLVTSNYVDNDYFWYHPAVDSTKMYEGVGAIVPFVDSTISLEPAEMQDAVKDSIQIALMADSVAMAAKELRELVEKATKDSSSPATFDTIVAVDTAAMIKDKVIYNAPESKEEREAREKFYRDKEIRVNLVKKTLAENVLYRTYDSTKASIQERKLYAALVDPVADMVAWTNGASFFSGMYPYYNRYNPYEGFNLGFDQVANIYFENDKVRMEQKASAEKEEDKKLLTALYNNKQNPALANYIKPTDLGFLSMSMNTEAAMKLYYKALKNIFNGKHYLGSEAWADAMVDLLEVALDEKGIADMFPGNSVLVLHGLKTKQVEYISYDYDSTFSYKGVTKTKDELSPDATLVFETRNEKIFNKLIDLPVKLNKDTTYNYTKTGDYYTFVLDKNEAVDSMFFMVKNGRCIITTSRKYVDQPFPSETNLSAATKQTINDNNYVIKVDIKSLLEGINGQITDKNNKKMMAYMEKNVGDMTSESTVKNDMITTTTIFNIKGDHKNGFEYFFNIINTLLKMSDTPVKEKGVK